MRIALVADRVGPLIESGTPDESDTIDVVTAPLAEALAARQHRVTLYARRVDVPAPAGVEVVRLGSGPAAPAGRSPTRQVGADPLRHLSELTEGLAEQWSADPPEIVHAMSWTTGLAAAAARPDTGLPLVQTFDGLGRPGPLDPAGRRRARLEAALARSAALVVARSTEEVTELTRLGVPRSAVTVIPSGVDLTTFTPDGPVAPRTGRQRVLTFGPLTAGYGIDIAVRALRRVPNAELVLVGGPHRVGGPVLAGDLVRLGDVAAATHPTDPAVRWLADQAARCRVGDRIRLTGPLPENDLPPLLRSADVAMFPARHEPCGAAALAAMACGAPLLATAVGALADIVAERATGELVPLRHPEAFMSALHDLLGNTTRLAGYRISAADRARARYGWERIAADTEAAYRRVLDRDRKAVAG
jgi:glycosyltransferase involved in cell wall biosynthesis